MSEITATNELFDAVRFCADADEVRAIIKNGADITGADEVHIDINQQCSSLLYHLLVT
jgi:hypothetical protein